MLNKTKHGIPLLGLGTWGIGGRHESDNSHQAAEVAIIRAALQMGYRLIDTAEVYGLGMAEKIVGEAIKGFPRADLYIVSKVYTDHLEYDSVLRAAEGSLKRLSTDYIDCYLIHWPNDAVPLEETISALRALKEQHLIKNFGVSNFDVPHLNHALKIAGEITVNQIEYNVLHQEAAKEIIPFCRKNNIDVMAYRPLFKGKVTEDPRMKKLALKYSAAVSELALAWILNQHIAAIPKASNREHMESNWKAQTIKLDKEDIEMMRDW